MKEPTRKVRLADFIDANTIVVDKDRYFSNAYVIDLPLESMPDHVWQDIFERQWKSGRHMWDRKLFVVGNKLRLVTTMDDIEDKLDWVKQIVERTNRDIDEYHQEEKARDAQIEGEMRNHSAEETSKGINMIKDVLSRRLTSG